MSYQVLARKWRPATFEQMVGQSHVLHALTNALTQQRLHHAYLFSGTRGVGKTSLARLFAKGLNCEQGITATACGQCTSCVEISEGRFIDLIEVDAASRTKIDDTRELLDNVQYRPIRGRFKVYLIDEVHMLSRSSFNALLKTLEEPPEHVKFLLATTDPQRLPVTVLSRCLQFNLKSLTQDEITQQLSHVLIQESLTFESQALSLLAKAANGSMRDALSLTDQAISFGGGEVRVTQVQTMLGSIDERHVITLFNAITQGNIEHLMQLISQVLSFGADPEEVLRSLLELLHQITLSQFAPAAAQLSIYKEQIKSFATQLNPEQVQLYYQLLLTGRKDLPHAPDPKSGLEMALLRAVSFVPEVPIKRWIVDKPAKVYLPEYDAQPIALESNPDTSVTSTDKSEITSGPEVENDSGTKSLENKIVKGSSCQEKNSNVTQSFPEESSETGDDEEYLIESLNSEQTLILIQATSQGMEQESYYTTAKSNIDNDVEEMTTVAPDSTEPAVEVEDETPLPSPNAVPDESYAQVSQFDAKNQYQEQFQDGYYEKYSEIPYDSSYSSVQQSSEISAQQEDYILDAVLVARDSLLTQLSAKKPKKKSSGKKYYMERKKFVPPKRNTPVVEPQELTQIIQNNNVNDESTRIEAKSDSSNVEYRPPWKEPLTPVIVEKDRANVTQSNIEETDKLAPETQSVKLQVSVAEPAVNVTDAEVMLPDDGRVTGNDIDLKWYRLMSTLDVGGRVRQLAVNSVCHHFVEPLTLLLKPNQKHLDADIAIVQLEEALGRALDKEINVTVSVGSDTSRETPLEIRQRFHIELLSQAHQGLMNDTHIRWLMAEMDAEFKNDSLSYSPELLSLKGNNIELIDKSNFKTLHES